MANRFRVGSIRTETRAHVGSSEIDSHLGADDEEIPIRNQQEKVSAD